MKLDVVEIKVKDWEGMVDWYSEKLGLNILAKEDEHKFALPGIGSGAVVAIWGEGTVGGGNNHITPYWRVEDIEEVVKELTSREVKFEGGIQQRHWGKQASFTDPEGNVHFLYQEKRSL